jgi:hypothetical protein
MDNQTALTSFYWFFNVILICVILYVFYTKYIPKDQFNLFIVSLAFKLIATLVLAYIFLYHFKYITDPQVFQLESAKLINKCIEEPKLIWGLFFENKPTDGINYTNQNRSFYFIKIITLLNPFTGNNYWINSLWLSLFCFLSVWYLLQKMVTHIVSFYLPTAFALLFVPTTVFWTSGLIKETICFGILCFLIANYIVFLSGKIKPRSIIISIIASYVLYAIKFYYLGAFLLVAFSVYASKLVSGYLPWKNYVLKSAIFILTLVITSLIANALTIKIYTVGIPDLIYYNHVMFLETNTVNFNFEGLVEYDYVSFLPYLHKALLHGLFMPLPNYADSFFEWVEAIVNFSTLVLCFISGFLVLKNRTDYSKKERQILAFVLVYVLICALAIGFSTPNWGSLARYKVMYIPFLHGLLLYVVSKTPLFHSLSSIFKTN